MYQRGFKVPPSYQGRQDVSVFAWLMAAMPIATMEETCRGCASEKLVHMRLASRRAADIACDKVSIRQHLRNHKAQDTPEPPGTPDPQDRKWPPAEKRYRTRWLPWQRRTPSWEAAYNTACAYAALNRDHRYARLNLDHRVVISLQHAINNPDCEMQRPSDWISQDPDFSSLKSSSKKFNALLGARERNDYPLPIQRSVDADGKEHGAVCDVLRSSSEAVLAGERG